MNDFLLLLHLERSAGKRLPRVELAKRMHVSASMITRMAPPMENGGRIGHEGGARDSRLAFTVVTQTGRTKLSNALATFAKRTGYHLCARFEGAEMDQFAVILVRLVFDTGGDLA